MKKVAVLASLAGLLGIGVIASQGVSVGAQNQSATGTISGTVTADAGEVRALRVKAKDTVNLISYTVFTNAGRYQIRNLPPSSYTVEIVEEEFEAPPQTVAVSAGAAQTVNLALKHRQLIIQGAGAAGAAAQSNYGAVRRAPDGTNIELVEFDELYPPSPIRDVMVKECFTCHGPSGWHGSGPKTEPQWRRAVERMFKPDGRVAGMSPGVPQTTYDRVSKEQVDGIVK